TRCFYQISRFISCLISSCCQLQLQKSQYLQLGPSRGLYYGGSLPNVNQIGNATVEVTFQVRYTSWRRTNSDSALHQSTLTPAQQAPFTGGSQELQPKRVLLLTVPGAGPIKQEENGDEQKQSWELKKEVSTSESCKVPGIHIFPSPDQQLTASLKPAAHNTGGSLPDLTNIQFPPPLPTPLDSDDAVAAAAASFGPSGATQAVSLTQGNAAVSCLLTSVMGFFCFPPIVVRGNSNELAESHLCCQLLLTLECLCETVFVFWVGVSTSQPAVTMEMQPEQDSMVPLILNAGESQSLHLPPTSSPLSLSQVEPVALLSATGPISAMNLEQQLSQYAFFNQQPSNQNQQVSHVPSPPDLS
ncbi:unnamed protein product, partial [Tetraodon nigroviridis]